MKTKSILVALVALFAIATNGQSYKSQRPEPAKRAFSSPAIDSVIDSVANRIEDSKLRWLFVNCFPNTIDTTVDFQIRENGMPYTFVITGDIDAMWLRDSGAQVYPYLPFMKKDDKLRAMIAGVVNQQTELLLRDPYANAFTRNITDPSPWKEDGTEMKPGVYERKWELDSPCYAIRLAYQYWKHSGKTDVFSPNWERAMRSVVKTFKQQQHKTDSIFYTFTRVTDRQGDTQLYQGKCSPVKPNGLIASAFRPSDDATIFGFLIPSNMFAVVSLNQLAEISEVVKGDKAFAKECKLLANEVQQAIEKYGIVNHPVVGKIYAYEIDGFGNALTMDDANVPSLLSIPYLGYPANESVYKNTRNFVWSSHNPYFYKGKAAEGVSGPHIGYKNIWPMSIIMRALTSTSPKEKLECIEMLRNSDAETGFMHESFYKDDSSQFTRSWFAWANTLFGELILENVDLVNGK